MCVLYSLYIYTRSQAKAAIGYSYGGEESEQARKDEQLLKEYLGETEGEGEGEDKAFSSEGEYGKSVWGFQFHLPLSLSPSPRRDGYGFGQLWLQ